MPPSPDWWDDATSKRLDPLFPEHRSFWHFQSAHPQLDGNGDAITAFASHCLEDCDQEMPPGESHLLYAVARRDGKGGVRVEIVGKVLRPE